MKILLPLGLVALLSFSFNSNTSRLTLEQAAQERMDLFLQREVLGPIGVRGPSWNDHSGFDKAGHPYAMAGWIATAADAARVGQLVLDEGRHGGVPLIAPDFMHELVAQGQPFSADSGLLWWRRARHTALVVDPAEVADINIDAIALTVDPTEDVLVFTDKSTGALYLYDLPQ